MCRDARPATLARLSVALKLDEDALARASAGEPVGVSVPLSRTLEERLDAIEKMTANVRSHRSQPREDIEQIKLLLLPVTA